MEYLLEAPPRFHFRRTVLSHGWSALAPFRLMGPGPTLVATVGMPADGAGVIRLDPAPDGVRMTLPGTPRPATRGALETAARRILNLDLDLEPFYARIESDPHLGWIARTGSGRLLRSATLFEDLVKLILTTNCNWALTTRMCKAILERYGAKAADGSRAFPAPDALADAGENELRDVVRAGYRAPYIAELARLVRDGDVHPDDWVSDPRPDEEIRRDLLKLPGVGPYVAENLLKMIGRPAGLALDSWMRGKYVQLYHGGRNVTDGTIARRYRRAGRWAAIAIWCDLTRDWLDRVEGPIPAWETVE